MEKTEMRKAMLENKISHRDFYLSVAKTAGIEFNVNDTIVQDALTSDDFYFNDISLNTWDILASCYKTQIRKALKEHGDFYSQAGGVCTIKAAVREAVQQEQQVQGIEIYVVTKDGIEEFRGTELQAMKYMHSHTPYSIDFATKNEGYGIFRIGLSDKATVK